MEIPEHAKKQARDAMSLPETQAWLRAFGGKATDVSPESLFTHREPPKPEPSQSDYTRPIPDHVKQLARDAVSLPETKAWIRQVEHDGEIRCPITLQRGTERWATKAVQLHKSGQDLDAVHKQLTKDNFGKERDYA